MKSISLIFAAAACFSSCLQAESANYSLWPRRPEAVTRALELQKQGADEQEILNLVTPHLRGYGIGGKEARKIAGRINAARYLSARRPNMTLYTVRGGDNFFKIADRMKCPVDVLMYLNDTMDPSALKIGQKLRVPALNLTMEIHSDTKEVLVWDGEVLVAAYPIVKESLPQNLPAKTKVLAREAFIDGHPVVRNSVDFPSADKELVLAGGRLRLTPRPLPAEGRDGWQLAAADATELALLVVPGNEVLLISASRSAGESGAAGAPAVHSTSLPPNG